MDKRRISLLVGIAVVVVGVGVVGFLNARSDPTAPTTTAAPEAGDQPLEIVVNTDALPAVESVGGLEEGDEPRPVGRMVFDDGVSDLVLGELIVAVESPEQLDGFLERHDGEVLDSFPGEDGEPDEHLVRIPVTATDPVEAARALAEVEEGHEGTYSVSDAHVLTMLLIAATEWRDHGIEVSLNWLSESTGIINGTASEAPNRTNPFDWSYLRVGGQVDTGVAGAWQLLEHHGKVGNRVKILIADGGFFVNPDFPDERSIRYSGWNESNPGKCSGGNDCPWHGTDVAVTALGLIDNGYGTAGVAGQVGDLLAVQIQGDFWTKMRRIKRVVRDERPAVVNMSFGWEVKAFRAASESSTDRHLGAMKRAGAIVFASAGNEGKNVDQEICSGNRCYENRLTIPCESRGAICVGGYDASSAWLHGGSNYGPKGDGRSVQFYAPFCVYTPHNPVNHGVTEASWTCGTSVSSPFMAGAAALVKAADPSLGPDEIWQVLRSTAHIGGLHFPHHIPTEHQVRVNVLDAVAKALGVEKTPPDLTVNLPDDGAEFTLADFIELDAVAFDFKGQPLEVTWESSVDGVLGTGFGSRGVFEPTAGTHVFTATATDLLGQETSLSVTVEVVNQPPVMSIAWPAANSLFYEDETITLVGLSLDPDTNGPLRNQDVWWEVFRSGQNQPVFGGTGHTVDVPAGTLDTGSHEVVFYGSDFGTVSETSTTLTVLQVVGSRPNVTITTQFQEGPYGYSGGPGNKFVLRGVANDPEDGPIGGTSFRWLVFADNGHSEVLCTGSNFTEPKEPGPFNPGLAPQPTVGPTIPPIIVIPVNCNNHEIELGLAPGAVLQTKWVIVLEVSDSHGQVGRDQAEVHVLFVVP